jgi:hypothetical protein
VPPSPSPSLQNTGPVQYHPLDDAGGTVDDGTDVITDNLPGLDTWASLLVEILLDQAIVEVAELETSAVVESLDARDDAPTADRATVTVEPFDGGASVDGNEDD